MQYEGLDLEAWDRFKAYRKAIRKPIKDASEHAMKLKLIRLGKDQDESINETISNQWTGFFELKPKQLQPGEKPVKSTKQKEVEEKRFAYIEKSATGAWSESSLTVLGKLKLADALLARYQLSSELDVGEKIEALKFRVGDLIKEADASEILGDYALTGLVRSLFSEKGVMRLKLRAGL